MTHLVNDLLDISRITSGRIRLQQETVEPGDLLESVIETQRQSAATARRREASRASAPQRHGHSSAICRVLIADDNHHAAASLSMLLQAMGHDTRVVH
ncbi:MAG: hypothetical protein KGJ72_13370, partial [Gammaproteobacteria bacterium]|nr:hypothetical protein [Gammaproteobacteria bacterium]